MGANYGPRQGGATGQKGLGYFGAIPNKNGGVSTELSAEQDGMHFPLLVPTLTAQEIGHLTSGGTPTPEIYRKAIAHAISRGQGGKDPFATQADMPTPLP